MKKPDLLKLAAEAYPNATTDIPSGFVSINGGDVILIHGYNTNVVIAIHDRDLDKLKGLVALTGNKLYDVLNPIRLDILDGAAESSQFDPARYWLANILDALAVFGWKSALAELKSVTKAQSIPETQSRWVHPIHQSLASDCSQSELAEAIKKAADDSLETMLKETPGARHVLANVIHDEVIVELPEQRLFVAERSGTHVCQDCFAEAGITDEVLSSEDTEVWEERSHGWVGQPLCRLCKLSIPVYVDDQGR